MRRQRREERKRQREQGRAQKAADPVPAPAANLFDFSAPAPAQPTQPTQPVQPVSGVQDFFSDFQTPSSQNNTANFFGGTGRIYFLQSLFWYNFELTYNNVN